MPFGRMLVVLLLLCFADQAGGAPLSRAELATLRETHPDAGYARPSDAARELAGRIGHDGNVDGIRAIVAVGQPELLSIAAQSFKKGARTLPAPLEALIVEHYRDPMMRRALFAFVGGDLDKDGRFPRYRTRALFDLLHADLKSDRAEALGNAIRIVATELQDVEPAFVELLPVLDPASANELVMFLGRRRYAPAVPALQKLQRTTPSARDVNGLIANIDRALLQIGTPDAVEAVLDRLHTLGAPNSDVRARSEITAVVMTLAGMPPDTRPDYASLRAVLPDELTSETQRELVKLIAARKDKRGLPELRLAVGRGNNDALTALLALGTPDDWRAGKANLEQATASGKLIPARVDGMNKRLEAAIADPARVRAELAETETRQAFANAWSQLARQRVEADKLRTTEPRRYASELEAWLQSAERLIAANTNRPEAVSYRRDVATAYERLARFTRFTLRDPKRAVVLYEHAIAAQEALPPPGRRATLSWLALADTLRFDLGDRRRCLEIYERLLREGTPKSTNDIEASVQHSLEQWLRAEIAFLAQDKRYRGTPDRESLGPVHMAMLSGAALFAADESSLAAMALVMRERAPDNAERRRFARQLDALPPSQGFLIGAFGFLPLLGTPEKIAAFLRRHDPTGYVTASAFAIVHAMDDEPAENRDRHHGMGVETWTSDERALMRRAEVAALGRRVVTDTRPDPSLATPESTWKTFVDALRRADLARAWTCTTPGIRNKFEPAFKAMTPAQLEQMADSISAFARTSEYGEFVEAFVAKASGNAGFVTFVRQGREWRIAEM